MKMFFRFRKLTFLVVFLSVFLTIGCSRIPDSSTKSEPNTPSVTATSTPTPTPTPSPEPIPTDTPTPTPTPDQRIEVNRRTFPDSAFRDYVLDHFDKDYDDMLSTEELLSAYSIDISNEQIENLTGIEYFTTLKNLNCSKNRLTSLNLSDLKMLDVLNCSENPNLTSVTLGESCETLSYLNCTNTNFYIDIWDCKRIKEVHCKYSGLKELMFRAESTLEVLECSGATISISGCTKLRILDCDKGRLLHTNTFDYAFPELKELYLRNFAISNYDLTQCPKLTRLSIEEYQYDSCSLESVIVTNLSSLTQADVCGCSTIGRAHKAKVDFSGCKNLKWLTVGFIKSIDVTGCDQLKTGYFSYDSTEVTPKGY